MREISFDWRGKKVSLTPSMQLLARVAFDLRKLTDGGETTVGLAYKCLNGGAEPVFLLIPLREFLREAKEEVLSDEDLWDHLSRTPKETISFRMAYVEAILPHVSLGKDRAALSAASGTALKKPRRKSTSKPST